MKRSILTSLFAILSLLFYSESYSQKIAITYLDDSWRLTIKDLSKYYRVGIIDTFNYQYYGEVKDYFISGRLQMKGKFIANVKVDTFYFYYPNGTLKSKGLYFENSRQGIWTNYYDNGDVKDKMLFNGDLVGIIEQRDISRKPKLYAGTGQFELRYCYNTNNPMNDSTLVEGEYVDTLRHGTWKYYKKSVDFFGTTRNRLECLEVYNRGKFIKGKYYDENGGVQEYKEQSIPIFQEDVKFSNIENWASTNYGTIESYPYLKFLPKFDSTKLNHINPDKFPEFPGGMTKFLNYIERSVKCSSTQNLVNGKILVEFIVDSEGFIKRASIKALNRLPSLCEQNIVEVLANSPKWTPGHSNLNNKEINVPVKLVLPIKII
jgi:antitoxin component YwqK of YwqJK toxin-antitoxin module